jgi:hypothetical protein
MENTGTQRIVREWSFQILSKPSMAYEYMSYQKKSIFHTPTIKKTVNKLYFHIIFN